LIDEQVTATVLVRNVGDVDVDEIHLNIDSDGLVVQGDLPSGFGLNEGTYRSEEVKLRFPATLDKGFHNISVNISWIDAHGIRDFLTESNSISITQPVEVYKSTTNEASLGQTVYASISVENIQSRPVRVRLDDALPMFFTLIDGTVTDNKADLNWDFVLSPHERKVVSYQMIPEQVGAHRVPKPHATWNLWGVNYTNNSDTDNVIAVYQGVSFLERDFPEPSPAPDDVIEENNENSPEISMSVTIRSAISTEVTPDKLDFRKLAPDDTSKRNDITTLRTTAPVETYWSFGSIINPNMLKVQETYEGVGSKTGTLMFWAEGVN